MKSLRKKNRVFLLPSPHLQTMCWEVLLDSTNVLYGSFSISWGSSYICIHNDVSATGLNFLQKLLLVRNNIDIVLDNIEEKRWGKTSRIWLNPSDCHFTGSVAWGVYNPRSGDVETPTTFFELASCHDKVRINCYETGATQFKKTLKLIQRELFTLYQAFLSAMEQQRNA